MPEGLVRDAILSSPAWPDIAAAMGRLDARGIDVSRILVDAHVAGAGVDQAVAVVAAVTTAAAAQAPAAAPAPAAATAPARAHVPAPAVGRAVPDRDVLAARMGTTGDPWAAPTPAPVPAPAAAPPPDQASGPALVAVSADARAMWGR
ncbi:hypothetical protein ACFY04_28835 [Streptomyces sp. NPDC001549]|uniref:hypothetical protein n=1 Tax=Streptomyces sp. NPDC001549 TaxID=3364586 RepID=UPI003698C29E